MLKDSSLLIERYDLLKSSRRWRVAFFIILAFFILSLVDSQTVTKNNSAHIARVSISGFIDVDKQRIDKLNKLAKNPKVKAVIIDIDSAGGTVVGGETLYYAIKNIARKKPVISYFGNQATSAAYMVALASDYIISPIGGITGSVGVIAQSAEFTGLAEKIGVTPIVIKSSKLKSVPNPAEKFDDVSRDSIDTVISDIYGFFLALVIENRKALTRAQIAEISTGKIFTGRMALEMGLVDDIGDFSKVKKWLDKKLVQKDLKIVEYKINKARNRNLLNYFNSFLFDNKAINKPAILSYWNPAI